MSRTMRNASTVAATIFFAATILLGGRLAMEPNACEMQRLGVTEGGQPITADGCR